MFAFVVPSASAAVTIDSPAEGYTGAPYLATANPSSPGEVVLLEWDFDGDGMWDANSTQSFEAQFSYASADNYTVRLRLTREVNASLVNETAARPVVIHSGAPEVTIDIPDRPVATVTQVFRAAATDPNPAHQGQPFSYAWAVDGNIKTLGEAEAQLAVDQPGPHVVSVTVTGAGGVTGHKEITVTFAAPGFFEGRGGMVNFAGLLTFASFGLAYGLARVQRRERHRASLKRDEDILQSSEEAVPGRRTKPAKVPLAGAAPAEAEAGGAKVVVGGIPSALEHTKECPVCHNAIDEDIEFADCPFCAANNEAAAVESKLAEKQYESLDLAEVRALLQRARRDRHLGKLEDNRKVVLEANELLAQLVKDRDDATEWIQRVRDSLSQTKRAGGKTERLERAESYFTLADSFYRAHQHGKAARHAKRAFEIMGGHDDEEETPEGDACPSCGKPIAGAKAAGAETCPHCGASIGRPAGSQPGAGVSEADLEKRVREEIEAIRTLLKDGSVERDDESWQLLKSAEGFERKAQWSQALELLKALRERFEREKAAAGTNSDEGGGTSPPPEAPGPST